MAACSITMKPPKLQMAGHCVVTISWSFIELRPRRPRILMDWAHVFNFLSEVKNIYILYIYIYICVCISFHKWVYIIYIMCMCVCACVFWFYKPHFGRSPSFTRFLASVTSVAVSAELAAMELSPAFVAPVLARSPALPTGAQRAKLGVNYQTWAVSFRTELRARRYSWL